MATSRTRKDTADAPMVCRAVSVVPGSINAEARTVDVTWTTGARVLRGHYDKFWEELSLEPKHVRLRRLNNGAPLLNAHDDYDASCVIGVVVTKSARIENGVGVATVRFAKAEDDPDADRIWRKVADGILQNISVGYRTYKMEKTEESVDKIPVFRAVDWEPHELSIVPMGADDGAGFRAADTEANPCVFVTPMPTATVTRTEENTMANQEETTPATESPAKAATRAARAEKVEEARRLAEAREAASEEATTAERTRMAGINDIAKRSKLGPAWAQRLIEAGTSVEEARKAAFDEIADPGDEIDAGTGLRISAGDDARDKFVRGASAWMFERTGTRKLIEKAREKKPDSFAGVSFDGGEFRGYSPLELARLSLERQGVRTRGMSKMDLLGLAFTHRSGHQTTSDFATLLENVLGKVLLGAYETEETTYERICGTEEVPDFRASNRYRTGSVGSLTAVAEHQEYQNGTIPDAAKYAVQTERKGKIFSLSREVLVNDDMGALTGLAKEFGRAAGRTIENGFYSLLAENSGLGPTMSDSNPFFHSSHSNVNATGSVISVAGLDLDRVVMRAQKDPSGLDYLSLSPAVLLVPDALRGTALVLNDAQYDPDTANKLQKPNMVRGLFREVIGTPRLAANTTRRYLFADPSQVAAFVVAYLEGYGRGPILESKDGWRIDGTEWRVTLYAKVQPGDVKGAVTNAGTT